MKAHSHFNNILTAVALFIATFAVLPAAASNGNGDSLRTVLLGGDISLLPTYEEEGTQYRDSAGTVVNFLPFVKAEGKWNAARVRLFVDPSTASQSAKNEGVLQSIDYIIPLCKQIKEAGMKLLLDFHYSDTWADPSHQTVPKKWQDLSPRPSRTGREPLCDSVYMHTKRSLEMLKENGIEPDLIQVGNEITYGMLWDYGRVSPTDDKNWVNLTDLLKAGTRACREVCPSARIVIHTEHAQSWNATYGYYSRLKKYGVDYDIIGLSYYPMWHGTISHLNVVLDSLGQYFPDKQIMVVETAAYYSHDNDRWATDPKQFSEFSPISIEGQREFTLELVSMLRKHDKVTGLFWWFPEENESGQQVIKSWINRGLFDNHTGRALPAFYEMAKFRRR